MFELYFHSSSSFWLTLLFIFLLLRGELRSYKFSNYFCVVGPIAQKGKIAVYARKYQLRDNFLDGCSAIINNGAGEHMKPDINM